MSLACMEMNEYIPPSLHEFAAPGGPFLPFLASHLVPLFVHLLLRPPQRAFYSPKLGEFMFLGFLRRSAALSPSISDRLKIDHFYIIVTAKLV